MFAVVISGFSLHALVHKFGDDNFVRSKELTCSDKAYTSYLVKGWPITAACSIDLGDLQDYPRVTPWV